MYDVWMTKRFDNEKFVSEYLGVYRMNGTAYDVADKLDLKYEQVKKKVQDLRNRGMELPRLLGRAQADRVKRLEAADYYVRNRVDPPELPQGNFRTNGTAFDYLAFIKVYLEVYENNGTYTDMAERYGVRQNRVSAIVKDMRDFGISVPSLQTTRWGMHTADSRAAAKMLEDFKADMKRRGKLKNKDWN